jgi:hypothetical protein
MAKTVVNNNQVPHLWANQSQPSARGNGSISFDGPVLYSYAAQIGRLVEAKDGSTVALLVSRTWSVTTSSHQRRARDAVSHLASFTVPNIDRNTDHIANLLYLVKEYRDMIAKAYRMRSWQDWNASHIGELWQRVRDYANAFDLNPPTDISLVLDLEAIEAFHNTPDKQAKKAKRAESDAKAKAALVLEQEWIAAEWRGGAARRPQSVDGYAYVRVVGETLQTSMGAEVPLKDAIRVFRHVITCKKTGRSWVRDSGNSLKVGSFHVDSIHADGSFVAGCHKFAWAEIKRAALALDDPALLNWHNA